MAVNSDFYYTSFGGTDFPDIDRLLTRAERAVEYAVLSAPQSEYQQEQYALAVCAQAEHMGLCGGVEMWAASVSGNTQSLSIGSFSISQGNASSEGLGAMGICSSAEAYLEKAGLLFRGCGIC